MAILLLQLDSSRAIFCWNIGWAKGGERGRGMKFFYRRDSMRQCHELPY